MTSRWLISDIAEELGEEPYWHTQETFALIDKTACPIVLVGMGAMDKKLARYPHLMDRVYKTLKFEQFNSGDIESILKE